MSSPLFLFAHGAGAGSSSPWMQRWATHLSRFGEVRPFDYPYMAAGRRAPDRLPKLLLRHAEILADARAGHTGPIILAGKSMGSRVGCHLANQAPIDALVCLGYPLCNPKRTKLRDDVLRALSTPLFLVQGSRDHLCPPELLHPVLTELRTTHGLHMVEGGNHSLEVGKRALAAASLTQADVEADCLDAIGAFLATQGLA